MNHPSVFFCVVARLPAQIGDDAEARLYRLTRPLRHDAAHDVEQFDGRALRHRAAGRCRG
jgi:hypothetical protein